MKKTVEAQLYLTNCAACGATHVPTSYIDFEEIPELENEVALCDKCKAENRPITAPLANRHYYKLCRHQDALPDTVRVITDLVIVEAGEKRHMTARCLNCRG